LIEDSNEVVYEKWKMLPECSIGRVVHFKSDPGYKITTEILGGIFQGIRWENGGRAYWIMVREWDDPEEEAKARKEALSNPEKYINTFISDILLFPIIGPAIMFPDEEESEEESEEAVPDILKMIISPFDVNTGKCYLGDGDHDYYTQTTVRAFPEAITIGSRIYLFDKNQRHVAIYKDGEVETCREGEPATQIKKQIKDDEERKHKEYIMKKCPVCPAEVEDNAPFCNMCGSNMTGAKDVAPNVFALTIERLEVLNTNQKEGIKKYKSSRGKYRGVRELQQTNLMTAPRFEVILEILKKQDARIKELERMVYLRRKDGSLPNLHDSDLF
jgi:hypothetical protein